MARALQPRDAGRGELASVPASVKALGRGLDQLAARVEAVESGRSLDDDVQELLAEVQLMRGAVERLAKHAGQVAHDPLVLAELRALAVRGSVLWARASRVEGRALAEVKGEGSGARTDLAPRDIDVTRSIEEKKRAAAARKRRERARDLARIPAEAWDATLAAAVESGEPVTQSRLLALVPRGPIVRPAEKQKQARGASGFAGQALRAARRFRLVRCPECEGTSQVAGVECQACRRGVFTDAEGTRVPLVLGDLALWLEAAGQELRERGRETSSLRADFWRDWQRDRAEVVLRATHAVLDRICGGQAKRNEDPDHELPAIACDLQEDLRRLVERRVAPVAQELRQAGLLVPYRAELARLEPELGRSAETRAAAVVAAARDRLGELREQTTGEHGREVLGEALERLEELRQDVEDAARLDRRPRPAPPSDAGARPEGNKSQTADEASAVRVHRVSRRGGA